MFLLHAFQAFVDLVGSWLTGRRLRQLAYAMPLALGIAAFVLFVPSHGAHASASGWIYETLGHFLYWLTSFLAKLLTQLIILVVNVASFNDFIDSTAVSTAWIVVRDLFNMVLVMLVLYSSISTILGINSNYQWSSQLPKLVFAAIAVNFSKVMAGLIIDAGQVMMLTFVNAFKDVAAGNLLNALGLDAMVSLDPAAYGAGVSLPDFPQLAGAFLLAVIALSIAVFVVASLLVFFVERIAWLWFLVAVSPIAFLSIASPIKSLEGLSSKWWSMFIEKVFSGIGIAFTLWLAFAVMQTEPGGTVTIQSTRDAAGIATISAVGEVSSFAQPQKLLSFAMGIALLVMALNLAKAAGGLAGSVATKGSAMGKAAAIGIGAYGVKKAGRATGVSQRIAAVKELHQARGKAEEERFQQQVDAKTGKYAQAYASISPNKKDDGLAQRTLAKVENKRADQVKSKVKDFEKMTDDEFKSKRDANMGKGSKEDDVAYHLESMKRGTYDAAEKEKALEFIEKHGDVKTKEYAQEYVKDKDVAFGYRNMEDKKYIADQKYDADKTLGNDVTLGEAVELSIVDPNGNITTQNFAAGDVIPQGTVIAKGSLKVNDKVGSASYGTVQRSGSMKVQEDGSHMTAGTVDYDQAVKDVKAGKLDPSKMKTIPMEFHMALARDPDVDGSKIPFSAATVSGDTGSSLAKDKAKLKQVYDAISSNKKKREFIDAMAKDKRTRDSAVALMNDLINEKTNDAAAAVAAARRDPNTVAAATAAGTQAAAAARQTNPAITAAQAQAVSDAAQEAVFADVAKSLENEIALMVKRLVAIDGGSGKAGINAAGGTTVDITDEHVKNAVLQSGRVKPENIAAFASQITAGNSQQVVANQIMGTQNMDEQFIRAEIRKIQRYSESAEDLSAEAQKALDDVAKLLKAQLALAEAANRRNPQANQNVPPPVQGGQQPGNQNPPPNQGGNQPPNQGGQQGANNQGNQNQGNRRNRGHQGNANPGGNVTP